MKQTTKFLHILMCMVLGLSVSMTSCKDYDDDIDGLNQRVDALEKSLSELSTDFGSLAYVKSVTFADGVLTVTPSEGQAQTYTIPDEDTNTTYSLDVQSDGQKVTITLKGSDNSTETKDFTLPQAESFDGAKLTVDNDGYICYNGVPTGVKLPEAAAGFDESKLTLGDDNCVYYDGKKTGVELDVFNPALLTVEGGKVLYAGVETSVTLPVTPTLDIKEITDGAGAVLGYAITYNGKTTNLKLAPEKLQGLVFMPDFYYGGIEAMGAYTIEYNALALEYVRGVNLNVNKDQSDDEGVAGNKASVTPNLVAHYHLNPSNVSADLLKTENMSFIIDDKAYYTKASDVVPTILDSKVQNGILTVTANLAEGTIKAIEDNQVTVLALQVGTRGVNNLDTLITSDYAAIRKTAVDGIVLSTIIEDEKATSCTETEGTDHLYTTAAAAIAAEPQFEIAYNDEDGIDVADLIQSHYDAEGVHTIWDKEGANSGVVEEYGFKYEYDLIGYMEGANKTSQSAHAALKGSLLRAQETLNGEQQEWGASQSRAIIGRMPLVRVTLVDTISHNVAAVGYIKFEIVEDTPAPSKDDFITIPTFTFDDNYTVSCATEDFPFALNWAQVEEQIYSTLNLSKEEFEAEYDLEGFEVAGTATGNAATQYTKADLTAAAVTTALGEVVRTTADIDGNMTEVLQWTVTADEVYENLVAKASISVIVRFEKENNNGTHHYVYVTFEWKPAVRNVTPQGEILDNADTKFPQAWFTHNTNDQGWDEVHFNVAVPTTDSDDDATNCTFEKNVLDVFTGQEVLVGNIASVYADFQTGLKTTFKFITPDVEEVKGVDGKTYVLSVSADGTALVATEKNTTNSANVAVLSGTSGNYTNNTVTFQENDIAKAVLNNADHTELLDGQTLTAKVQMNVVNKCDKPIEVLNNEFDVKFLRPISVLEIAEDVLEDALDGGDVIEIADVLAFTDWREYEFADHENYFGFYGVSAIAIDEEAVTIDMGNGNYRLLKEVYPAVDIAYTPATGDIAIDNMGTFSWKNNGTTLSADATIVLPVEVTYKWGTVKKDIHVTVKKTVGQD